MTRDEKVQNIKKQVHSEFHMTLYQNTSIRIETNCYSHAIGSTLPYIKIYRIGAISGKKDIESKYKSIDEIKYLLNADMETLELKIKECLEDEVIERNQHKIGLFVRTDSKEELIFDYHFVRQDSNGEWTEKWRGQYVQKFYNNNISKYKSFPWKLVGFYKITR